MSSNAARPPFARSTGSPPRRGGGRSAVRSPVGASTVTTPWFPAGLPKRDLRLVQEAEAFASLTLLTPLEVRERRRLCDMVGETLVDAAGAQARFVLTGAMPLGIAQASSDLGVCVGGCTHMQLADGSLLNALGPLLQREGLELSDVSTAGNLSFRLHRSGARADESAVVNVALHADVGTVSAAERTLAAAQAWTLEFPSVVAAHAVVARLLSQCGNIGGRGGLCEAALLGMLVATARRLSASGTTPDAGDIITGFCQCYGDGFNFETTAVDPTAPDGTAPRAAWGVADDIVVVDPATAVNLAGGCRRLAAIRASLRTSSFMLSRWTGPRKRGCYKGRTPLSGMITYRDLWERSRRVLQRPASPPVSEAGATDEKSSGSEDDRDELHVLDAEDLPELEKEEVLPALADADEEEDDDDLPPLVEDEDDSTVESARAVCVSTSVFPPSPFHVAPGYGVAVSPKLAVWY
eukprot:TRINITY_DN1917_c0_g1_i1.p1 TRINITY_DN1917_c0_g1~~TRINITY_DN1917_c0_g1_i1.p1  ORF type:complete len:466 (+),score=96.61 TRINITY_DN1917_c0_g1_i1:74-1471(+)